MLFTYKKETFRQFHRKTKRRVSKNPSNKAPKFIFSVRLWNRRALNEGRLTYQPQQDVKMLLWRGISVMLQLGICLASTSKVKMGHETFLKVHPLQGISVLLQLGNCLLFWSNIKDQKDNSCNRKTIQQQKIAGLFCGRKRLRFAGLLCDFPMKRRT